MVALQEFRNYWQSRLNDEQLSVSLTTALLHLAILSTQ
jgi:hypothetical protein